MSSPAPIAANHVRRRRDLKFQPLAADRWNVFDPLTRQSYRIGIVEHWLLTRPDGRISPPELLAKLRHDFPTLELDDGHVLGLLANLCRQGLLLGEAAPSAARPRHGFWQSWLASMVVWQIRGLNPDRWLNWLAPHTSLFFTSRAVAVWLLLAAFTLVAVLLDFQRLATQSGVWQWILRPTTGGWLLLVFVVTRGLHELGHAVVCKRFGIRCPDIGLFVILGAPCVYCDVSESWQLPHRWQRAAVAAAGMYVELIVATLAAWLWLVTIPGYVNTLALQTMLVCSASTLIINANPLMRFDGYYLLSDWLDEVNLRAQADGAAAAELRWWVLGVTPPVRACGRGRHCFLLLFSVLGWLYRAGLSMTVATLLVSMYAAWNLTWVGRGLAVAILFTWWGIPAMSLCLDLTRAARQQRRSWRLACWAAAAVVACALLPVPSRQWASGWVQPSESRGVYAGVTAQLGGCNIQDGAEVAAGTPLFQFRSPELEIRRARYAQLQAVANIRLAAQQRRRDMHEQEVDVQPYVHQLHEAEHRLDGVERELDALTVTAPIAGRLVAMPAPHAALSLHGPVAPSGPVALGGAGSGRLLAADAPCGASAATWCDPQQVGRWVAEGCQLASICSPHSVAVIPLHEDELSSVAAGTPARVRIAQQRLVLDTCRVKSVVQIGEVASPWQAAACDSLLAAQPQPGELAAARFAAVIELPATVQAGPGAAVDAVFVGPPQTLAQLATRWLHSHLRLFGD